jgi:protein tyrosine phosphatase
MDLRSGPYGVGLKWRVLLREDTAGQALGGVTGCALLMFRQFRSASGEDTEGAEDRAARTLNPKKQKSKKNIQHLWLHLWLQIGSGQDIHSGVVKLVNSQSCRCGPTVTC